MLAPETVFVTLNDLAARWKASVPTARNRTLTTGFPPALHLGERSLRWPLEEVQAMEDRRYRTAAHHRT
jgi:predicted DNA-binding transcriptional regulator AlpA